MTTFSKCCRYLAGLLWGAVFTLQGAVAQTPAPSPAQAKSKPAAAKSTKQAVKKASESEPPLDSHELSIAQRVHIGQLPCELGASVNMSADAVAPGYFNLQGKGYKYRMRPVATSTGAIRLEDAKAGAVWLQLSNKSMLMDQINGRRLADECAHPDQVAVANDMKINPPPALIDTSMPVRR
ncbi:MAG: hypothetical protein NT035_14085 [Burkholderiales bacterium]|nr:hypothetical protein [Burkholderiales bacterium]